MHARPLARLLCATVALTLVGCTGAVGSAPDAETPVTPPTPGTIAPPRDDARANPVDSYLAWLSASREPDAPLACSLMSAELQERMMAEFAASLGTAFPDCETMITATAALFSAAGSSADVDVKVVAESATEATLFSTYTESGKCGTIHLASAADGWIITEQSEECVG